LAVQNGARRGRHPVFELITDNWKLPVLFSAGSAISGLEDRTMTRVLAGAFALLFALAVAAPTAQINVAGDWDVMINGPQGAMEATLTLAQDGDTVSGTLESLMGAVEVAGAVAANLMRLAFDVDAGGQMITITMIGEVNGSSMEGSLDFGQGTADFTAKRK
jgi:hypothetical protein